MRYVNVTAASHPKLHLAVAWGAVACGHYFPMPGGHRSTVWRFYGVGAARLARVEAALAGFSVVALAKAFNRGALPGRGVESLVESAVEYNFDGGGWGGPVCSAYPLAVTSRAFDRVWGGRRPVVAVPPAVGGGAGGTFDW